LLIEYHNCSQCLMIEIYEILCIEVVIRKVKLNTAFFSYYALLSTIQYYYYYYYYYYNY